MADAAGRQWCPVARAYLWVPTGARWSDVQDAEDVELTAETLDDALVPWRPLRGLATGAVVSAVRLSPASGAPCDWRPAMGGSTGAAGWRSFLTHGSCSSFVRASAVAGATADALLDDLLLMPEWEQFFNRAGYAQPRKTCFLHGTSQRLSSTSTAISL